MKKKPKKTIKKTIKSLHRPAKKPKEKPELPKVIDRGNRRSGIDRRSNTQILSDIAGVLKTRMEVREFMQAMKEIQGIIEG